MRHANRWAARGALEDSLDKDIEGDVGSGLIPGSHCSQEDDIAAARYLGDVSTVGRRQTEGKQRRQYAQVVFSHGLFRVKVEVLG